MEHQQLRYFNCLTIPKVDGYYVVFLFPYLVGGCIIGIYDYFQKITEKPMGIAIVFNLSPQ
jgi:hypothetical protein